MANPNNPPAPEVKLVICPECETEVNLTEGDTCKKCGLDVAWCLEKARRDRAVKRLVEGREAEERKAKKPGWGFGD
jgi:hypothetical protein